MHFNPCGVLLSPTTPASPILCGPFATIQTGVYTHRVSAARVGPLENNQALAICTGGVSTIVPLCV